MIEYQDTHDTKSKPTIGRRYQSIYPETFRSRENDGITKHSY